MPYCEFSVAFLFQRCFLLSCSSQNNFCICPVPNLWVRCSRASQLHPSQLHAYLTAELPFGGDPHSISYRVGKLHGISHRLLKTRVQIKSSILQRWGFYSRHTNNSCSGTISHKPKHLTWTKSTLTLSQTLLQTLMDLGQVILYFCGPVVKWKSWYFLKTLWTKRSFIQRV